MTGHVQPKQKNIPIAELHFDPQNPRLSEEIRTGSEDVIIEWMLKDESIIGLMASISSTGYSAAEPILVAPNPDEAIGGYIVVEGNRRLTAVKLLNDPSRAMLRSKMIKLVAQETSHAPPQEMPALVYQHRDDILDYLGYRHITGVKTWGARAKAEYLWQLYKRNSSGPHGLDSSCLKHVAKAVGSTASAAKKTITTLKLVNLAEENALWNSGDELDRDMIEFSVLGTALSYAEIKKFINLNDENSWELEYLITENVELLLKWLFGKNKKVSESRKISTLAKVVASAQALEKLKNGAELSVAAEYSGEALDNYRKFLDVALSKLKEVDAYSSRIASSLDTTDVDNTKECFQLAKKIYNHAKLAIDDDMDE